MSTSPEPSTSAGLTGDAPPAVACTLGQKDLAERVLEWSDLRDLAISAVAIEGGVASTYPADLRDRIADLVDRERSCCGTWLVSKMSPHDDGVLLSLTTTNPDGLAVIERMVAPAASDT